MYVYLDIMILQFNCVLSVLIHALPVYPMLSAARVVQIRGLSILQPKLVHVILDYMIPIMVQLPVSAVCIVVKLVLMVHNA